MRVCIIYTNKDSVSGSEPSAVEGQGKIKEGLLYVTPSTGVIPKDPIVIPMEIVYAPNETTASLGMECVVYIDTPYSPGAMISFIPVEAPDPTTIKYTPPPPEPKKSIGNRWDSLKRATPWITIVGAILAATWWFLIGNNMVIGRNIYSSLVIPYIQSEVTEYLESLSPDLSKSVHMNMPEFRYDFVEKSSLDAQDMFVLMEGLNYKNIIRYKYKFTANLINLDGVSPVVVRCDVAVYFDKKSSNGYIVTADYNLYDTSTGKVIG